MEKPKDEYTLEFLLAFDGRVHWLEQGYMIKFEIKRVEPTPKHPHGLRYSFTLHDPDGNRLVGFDNAHRVPVAGTKYKRKPMECDHWHRSENDLGRPYRFKDAETLLIDFFNEVRRVLKERGISETVQDVTVKKRGKE